MKALILIDYQNDFVSPLGSLYVPKAETLITKIIQKILSTKEKNIPVIATKDWHPNDHISFADRHKLPVFSQHEGETLWPDHCVQESRGAQLFGIPENLFDHIINKGVHKDQDAYSGFKNTNLNQILQDLGVTHLELAGVATDFCVNATAQDATNLGYKVTILEDLVSGIDEKKSGEVFAAWNKSA